MQGLFSCLLFEFEHFGRPYVLFEFVLLKKSGKWLWRLILWWKILQTLWTSGFFHTVSVSTKFCFFEQPSWSKCLISFLLKNLKFQISPRFAVKSFILYLFFLLVWIFLNLASKLVCFLFVSLSFSPLPTTRKIGRRAGWMRTKKPEFQSLGRLRNTRTFVFFFWKCKNVSLCMY